MADSARKEHNQGILEDFLQNQETFKSCQPLIIKKIKQVLDQASIPYVTVEGRVKDPDSLKGKLDRKGEKYDSIVDITDLLGLRIITYYTGNVDSICALLEKLFQIDWPNSHDKRALLSLDRIGYLSVHYICYLPDLGDEKIKKLASRGIRFEIQVRTLLQHMWAQSQHDIVYKSRFEIPKEYVRPINLLSGLLELADNQFSELLENIGEYRRKVKKLIESGDFAQLELDGDTFRNYLKLNPFGDLTHRIAAVNGMEVVEIDLSKYVKNFVQAGCKTIQDVEDLRKKYTESAYNLAVRQFTGSELDIVSSSVALHFIFKAMEKDRKETGE